MVLTRLLQVLIVLLLVAQAAADTVDVYVFNNQFSINQPGQPIRHPVITAGDSVRWVWLQGNHTTTSVAGSMEVWNAPISSGSPNYTHTFMHPGVFWYYCIPHGFDNGDGTAGGMSGTVTVLPSGIGACCLPMGCEQTTQASCLTQGGVFHGVGTPCDPDPCKAAVVTVEIVSERDSVLYETADGSLANSLGRYLYVGNQNSGNRRRSLLYFDLSQIPAGAMVVDAQVRLFCNSSQGSATAVTLRRLLSDWGEGTSIAGGNEGSGAAATPGDATWRHTFFPNQFWSTPGGDFLPQNSSSTIVSAQNTAYTWSGGTISADVQHWLHMPGTNFGWIMQGDEASSSNTKRFNSRDSVDPANRPRLIVTYVPAGPTGACCLSDGGCEQRTAMDCDSIGGSFWGVGTDCESVLCPVVLEPFVDALPIPGVAAPTWGSPGSEAHYEISMTEQFQQLHRDLPPTRVWGYEGSYPGPTIEARRGEMVTVKWINDIRVAETGQLRTHHVLAVDECLHGPDMTGSVPVTVVHLHGGKVPPDSDGYPEEAFPPGQASHVYTYPNIQPAGTLWYHDHALGITRLNVMMGLAGFYLIRDHFDDGLDLPSGAYEIPLAIQDRTFAADGSFAYPEQWHEHFFGDTILVNGKVWPYLEVDRGKYRFRMLNGSNSRAYTLSLSDGSVFWQIGTDLGLTEYPVALHEITLLPGERADVIIDFGSYAPGTEVVLANSAPAPFPGFPGVGVIPDVMLFRVTGETGHTAPIPGSLVEVPWIDPGDAVVERVLELKTVPNTHCPDHHDAMWTIDGRMWHEITEYPVLGTVEIWTWKNNSGISHPMHIHLVMSQILNRQAIDDVTGEPVGPVLPPRDFERGWKDTVDAPPGYFTRVIARFDGFTGLYPYHCHILEHEDHEMMRQFEVVAPPCPADLTGDGVLNFFDLAFYLTLFNSGDPAADLAPPFGLINFFDLSEYLSRYNAGCP